MRSRKLIESTFNKSPRNECIIQNQKLILEVQLDIRTVAITMEANIAGLLGFFRAAMGEAFNESEFKIFQISALNAMHKMLDTPLAQVEQSSKETPANVSPSHRNKASAPPKNNPSVRQRTSASGNATFPEKIKNPGPIFDQAEEDDDLTPL